MLFKSFKVIGFKRQSRSPCVATIFFQELIGRSDGLDQVNMAKRARRACEPAVVFIQSNRRNPKLFRHTGADNAQHARMPVFAGDNRDAGTFCL